MSNHVYFAVENLALNGGQKNALLEFLNGLGPNDDPSPARCNHWRTRLDNDARIYEAAFEQATIGVGAFKARLALIFGVDAADISHGVVMVTFAERQTAVATYSYGGTDYLRVGIFGYTGGTAWPSCAESRAEARAYISDHAAAWGDNT